MLPASTQRKPKRDARPQCLHSEGSRRSSSPQRMPAKPKRSLGALGTQRPKSKEWQCLAPLRPRLPCSAAATASACWSTRDGPSTSRTSSATGLPLWTGARRSGSASTLTRIASCENLNSLGDSRLSGDSSMRWYLALLALGVSASAQAEWYRASSEHFLIYSEQKPDTLKQFAEKLERFDSAVRVVRGMDDLPPSQ